VLISLGGFFTIRGTRGVSNKALLSGQVISISMVLSNKLSVLSLSFSDGENSKRALLAILDSLSSVLLLTPPRISSTLKIKGGSLELK
jgi:hypothetical protein